MAFVFAALTLVLVLAIGFRSLSRLTILTIFVSCCSSYAIIKMCWPSATSTAPDDENAQAKRRLATAMASPNSTAQYAGETSAVPADDITTSADWRRWPSQAPLCPDSYAESFDGFFSKGEATFYISRCAHASAGNVQALAYAGSQEGSTAVDTVRTLIHFANAAHLYPTEFKRCLEASGVAVKDASGNWRDMTDLLLAYSRQSQDMHSCVKALAAP